MSAEKRPHGLEATEQDPKRRKVLQYVPKQDPLSEHDLWPEKKRELQRVLPSHAFCPDVMYLVLDFMAAVLVEIRLMMGPRASLVVSGLGHRMWEIASLPFVFPIPSMDVAREKSHGKLVLAVDPEREWVIAMLPNGWLYHWRFTGRDPGKPVYTDLSSLGIRGLRDLRYDPHTQTAHLSGIGSSVAVEMEHLVPSRQGAFLDNRVTRLFGAYDRAKRPLVVVQRGINGTGSIFPLSWNRKIELDVQHLGCVHWEENSSILVGVYDPDEWMRRTMVSWHSVGSSSAPFAALPPGIHIVTRVESKEKASLGECLGFVGIPCDGSHVVSALLLLFRECLFILEIRLSAGFPIIVQSEFLSLEPGYTPVNASMLSREVALVVYKRGETAPQAGKPVRVSFVARISHGTGKEHSKLAVLARYCDNVAAESSNVAVLYN
jgi:hypothetical protein